MTKFAWAPALPPVSDRDRKAVMSRFSMKQLNACCSASEDRLFSLCNERPKPEYALHSRNARILGVAHCDWMTGLKQQFAVATLKDETLIFSPQLDDRIGVYTLLYLLPSLGVAVDTLLTTDEEIGRSTASEFTTDKQYNWMCEFDRRGTDVVSYQYHDMKEHTKKFFTNGYGSFSDISCLDHLGVLGMNVGVAYSGEHTNRCFMVLEDYIDQIVRFVRFYREYKNIRLDYVKPPQTTFTSWDKRLPTHYAGEGLYGESLGYGNHDGSLEGWPRNENIGRDGWCTPRARVATAERPLLPETSRGATPPGAGAVVT